MTTGPPLVRTAWVLVAGAVVSGLDASLANALQLVEGGRPLPA